MTRALYSCFHNGVLIPDCGATSHQTAWKKLKAKLADQHAPRQLNARFLRMRGYDVRKTGAMQIR